MFTPFLKTVGSLLRLWEDGAELWVSSLINLLHVVSILIITKGSQTEPETVASPSYLFNINILELAKANLESEATLNRQVRVCFNIPVSSHIVTQFGPYPYNFLYVIIRY